MNSNEGLDNGLLVNNLPPKETDGILDNYMRDEQKMDFKKKSK